MPSDQEFILAQEQSVMAKSSFEKEVEGTLVLTNQRLIFVGADEEQDVRTMLGKDSLRFADLDNLDSIPRSQYNLSIPLKEIESDRGSHLGHPSLRVKWIEDANEKHEEFIERLTGGRKKNLNDWAKVIEKIKSGEIRPKIPETPPPTTDTLEGKILYVLGDMQEKGSFEIEAQVEQGFKVDLDPEEVEESCKTLVASGFIDVLRDPSGDDFYRKHSPLGEDDLSS